MKPGGRKGGSEDVLILSGSLVLTLAPPRGLMQGARPSTLGPEDRILLPLVDGRRSIQEVTQLSGLSPAVARDHLRALFERGVLVLTDSAGSGAGSATGTMTSSSSPERRLSPRGPRLATPEPFAALLPAPPPTMALRGPPHTAHEPRWREPESPSADAPGARGSQPFRVGSYEVATRIGQGGMGSIYVCRRVGTPGFQRLFALKVVRQHSGQEQAAVRSLLDEGRVGGLVAHPNLQSVVDMGTYKDQPFLVLDYVEGVNLSDLMAEGRRVPVPVVVSILLDVLRGLAAAHDVVDPQGRPLGLVHGDVSPPNILVGVDGAARLSDFGSARFTSPGVTTAEPVVPGRPAYMSPEQLCAEPIDARTDIFALGVVMWRALTGEDLFTAETYDQTALNVLRKKIPLPSTFGAPAILDDICLRALNRTREGRYSTAEEMSDALLKVARPADLVAAPRRVGQLVRELFGEVLAERRRRTQEVFGGAGGTAPADVDTEPARDHDAGRPTRGAEPTLMGPALRAPILPAAPTSTSTSGARPGAPETVQVSAPAIPRGTVKSSTRASVPVNARDRANAAAKASRSNAQPSVIISPELARHQDGNDRRLSVRGRYIVLSIALGLLAGTLAIVLLRSMSGPVPRVDHAARGTSPPRVLTTDHSTATGSAAPRAADTRGRPP